MLRSGAVTGSGRRAVALGLLVGIVTLLALSGGIAAPASAEHVQLDSADEEAGVEATVDEVPIDERATDPLANETGTTSVVVRFPPMEPRDLADTDDDQVVEELREHASDERVAFEAFAAGTDRLTIERTFWLANAVLVSVDADETDADELLSVANVTDVHRNVVVATHSGAAGGGERAEGAGSVTESVDRHLDASTDRFQVGTEPTGSHTDGLEAIDVPAAWERFDTRGAGATVAVIDTGVDPAHQDIELAAWADFDENGTLVSDDVADATDPDGHGTHVAGTVAGGEASGTHIGVAPEAAIHGIDAFGEDGSATFAGVLAAMEHATADDDVDVLQMSLGANGTFRGFIMPVRNARAAGSIVVAAAGNDGENTSSSPANVYDSLAVGAVDTDENRTVAAFSSGEPIEAVEAFGEIPEDWPEQYVVPDVSAPGVAVVSAESGTTDGYVRRQGTSMAAPHVSGVAALAIAATDGRVEGDELHDLLVDTAVHPTGAAEPDARYGHGVVDGPAAVEAALAAAPPPEPVPTENGDETDDEGPATDDRVPGFGVVPAVVAVLVALLGSLAAVRDGGDRRRREGL